MPNSAAVTIVKIENFKKGRSAICDQRLTTSATEQPTISNPPINSPQRIFFSCMKAAITCAKGFRGCRGGVGGGGGGRLIAGARGATCATLGKGTSRVRAGA